MVLLGLDPGIARTGFGLLATGPPARVLKAGCFTTAASLATADRLLALGQDLHQLLAARRPDVAVVEQIFFGLNSKTAMLTAHTRGVMLYVLRSLHIPVHSLTPLQIKSRLTGYGAADKQQVQRLVAARLHLKTLPQPDDVADALAAALCLADEPSLLPAHANAQ